MLAIWPVPCLLESNTGSISENRNIVQLKIPKIRKSTMGGPRLPSQPAESRHRHRRGTVPYFSLAALRVRAAALFRSRSIWPLGKVTQISPIHSSFTPLIGLALKLVRLTSVEDFPRSIVFR